MGYFKKWTSSLEDPREKIRNVISLYFWPGTGPIDWFVVMLEATLEAIIVAIFKTQFPLNYVMYLEGETLKILGCKGLV